MIRIGIKIRIKQKFLLKLASKSKKSVPSLLQILFLFHHLFFTTCWICSNFVGDFFMLPRLLHKRNAIKKAKKLKSKSIKEKKQQAEKITIKVKLNDPNFAFIYFCFSINFNYLKI